MPPTQPVSPRPAAPLPVDAGALPARERWRRAFAALADVIADPDRTDKVLEFTLYANAGTLGDRADRFLGDPRGKRLFDERRAIDSKTVDLEALGQLPEGTLGRAYAEFLTSRGLTPDVFDGPPQAIADPRSAYVVQRLRQTHDLWHVVTGYDTDPASEVALQAFTFGQLRAPSAAILATAGTLRGVGAVRALPRGVLEAFVAGRRAIAMAVFAWEDHWATPLDEVRAMLRITPVRATPRTPLAAAA